MIFRKEALDRLRWLGFREGRRDDRFCESRGRLSRGFK